MLAVRNPVTKQSDLSFDSCKLQVGAGVSIVRAPSDLGDLWQGP